MAAITTIVSGMTPAEFISAVNDNFALLDDTCVAITDEMTGAELKTTINGNISLLNALYPSSVIEVDYGISGSVYINRLNTNGLNLMNKKKVVWVDLIITDHKAKNSHIPDAYYEEHYRPVLEEFLSADYEDDETTGYYVNTFGPTGLNTILADFFLLFFWNPLEVFGTALAVTEGEGFYGGTYRQNIEGKVYNQGAKPNHTYLGIGTIILSKLDWSDTTYLAPEHYYLVRYLPSFYYLPNFKLYTSSNRLKANMTSYAFNQVVSEIILYSNMFTGIAPKIVGYYVIKNNYFTDIDLANTVFTTTLAMIDVSQNTLTSATLDELFSMLNTFFSTHTPTMNLIIHTEGDGNGDVTGVITEEVWSENADIVGLRASFASAGKTLTITYNSDEFGDAYKFSESIAIFTFDDVRTGDLTFAKPLFDSLGIKFTSFIPGGRIGTSSSWLSWVQIKLLSDAGYDMQCHGFTHDREELMSEEELRQQMTDNNAAFVAAGLPAPIHHAWPLTTTSEAAQAIVADYRQTARGGPSGFNDYAFIFKNDNKMNLPGVYVDIVSEDHLIMAKHLVDAAIEANAAILLWGHATLAGYGYNETYMRELVEYVVVTKGMTVMTMKAFWEEYGDEFI